MRESIMYVGRDQQTESIEISTAYEGRDGECGVTRHRWRAEFTRSIGAEIFVERNELQFVL